jgi:hypothetical protein
MKSKNLNTLGKCRKSVSFLHSLSYLGIGIGNSVFFFIMSITFSIVVLMWCVSFKKKITEPRFFFRNYATACHVYHVDEDENGIIRMT